MAKYDAENYRFVPRNDAVKHGDRWVVPTIWGEASGNTRWLEPKDLGEVIFQFNEDQTEITLHAPEGTKFGCGFPEALKKLIPPAAKPRIIELRGAYQDGPHFYREMDESPTELEGNLIVSYLDMVKNDYDTVGAQAARERFIKEFPQYAALPPGEYQGEDLNALIEEYRQWCAENKLPWIDARELLLNEDRDLTQEQIEWLDEFLGRWEASEKLAKPTDFLTVTGIEDIKAALTIWAVDPMEYRIKEMLYVPSDTYGKLFVFLNDHDEYWSIDGREEILTKDRAEAFKWAMAHA